MSNISRFPTTKRNVVAGKGKSATKMKEEDFIEQLLVANTHDTILCFSSRGRLYWLRVFQLPQASRGARGRPIVNILPLQPDERITAILPVAEYAENKFIFMATASGYGEENRSNRVQPSTFQRIDCN
jgi:DNA gyrase subunit A